MTRMDATSEVGWGWRPFLVGIGVQQIFTLNFVLVLLCPLIFFAFLSPCMYCLSVNI